jgi:type IV secretion system protein VirD4
MRRVLAILGLTLLPFGACWAATQYAAAQLGFAAALGPLWCTLGDLHFYAPWAWVSWSRRYEGRAPVVFRNASGLTTLGALAGLAAAAVLGGRARRTGAPSRAHGSSRWATTAELAKAGLLRDGGVVLCQTSEARFHTRVDRTGAMRIRSRRLGHLVRSDGPEHVLCFAPTGSGKGVGLVVPTLLTWPHSVLVYDIKRENWELTAGWRRQFSRVWRFEPTALDSVRFNPLLEVRKGLFEVKDVQNIADMLVDPAGDKESRDHWQTTAHALLTGAILHVLYAEGDKTLAGVAAFLSDPSRTQAQTLERMLTTRHLPSGPHSVVAQVAREAASKHDRELSSVWSTALSYLGLYRDPVIARSTAESDFRIVDLVAADAPVSLYLVVPPSDLTRTRPLVRLMLNQIGRRLTESMHVEGRRRLLLLLDEFPALGRLDFFESSLAFIRGYGMKAMLIVQDLSQLEKAYGPHSSIMGNCGVRFTYAANDDRTAKRISDLLGQATERKLQKSRSGSGWWLSSRTESEQEFGRPLLTPGEVTQLSHDEGLLLVGGMLPYRARKVRYFVDPRFRDRAGRPPPDAPEEQARELLAPRPSEWAAHMVPAASAPPVVMSAPAPAPPAPSVAPAWARVLKSAIPEVKDAGAPKPAASRKDDIPF